MNIIIILAFLFFLGSITGWGLEVIFRRYFSSANPGRKWINPGFLSGPYLPLYGCSLCALYLLAGLEPCLGIENPAISKLVLFAIMAASVTAIEYVAGLIFIKGMKVKLWDYSTQWGNIQGIICPKFTFFWAVLSAIYFFLIHPHILSALHWLSENLAFSFCIGFFFGVFTLDFIHSANLLVKIRRFAEENGIVVRFEELKAGIRAKEEKNREKARFLLAMFPSVPLGEHLKEYYEKCKEELEHFRPHRTK